MAETDKNLFRNRLEYALAIRGIKPVDLAKKAGLSEQLISQYRSGRSAPKREKLISISKALDVNPVWLMGYNVPMDIEKTTNNIELTVDEIGIIEKYRDASDMEKEMVKRVLKYVELFNKGGAK